MGPATGEEPMANFAEWDTFYVIVGGAAGALIGLQFVVITLIADRPRPSQAEAGAAFLTPNIVHFCAVLFLSALVRAPWRSLTGPTAVWCASGLLGLGYIAVVTHRIFAQRAYQPEGEDWLFHIVLPVLAYGLLAASPLVAFSHEQETLFTVAAATLVLLFIGIHNAWDAVTYNTFVLNAAKPEGEQAGPDSNVTR
jgi:hypothetical protein